MYIPLYQRLPRGRRALDPQCEPEDRRRTARAWKCNGCNVWWLKIAGDTCPQCEWSTQDLREMKLLGDVEVIIGADGEIES